MKTNIAVDTNIFLYALDDQNIYHSKAAILLNNPSYTLHITTKNISEYFAVASKLNIDFVKAFQYLTICFKNINPEVIKFLTSKLSQLL